MKANASLLKNHFHFTWRFKQHAQLQQTSKSQFL